MNRVVEALDVALPIALVTPPAAAVPWLAIGGIAIALHDLWRHFRTVRSGR